MRAAVWVLAAALVAGGCAGTPASGPGSGGDGAAASCVGPYVDASPPDGRYGAPPPMVAPGAEVTLYGHWYTSACNDTSGLDDPVVPLPDVTLTVTWPDGRTSELGPYAPGGSDMGFTAALTVPPDVPAGTATVSDGRGGPGYTFTVGRPDGG